MQGQNTSTGSASTNPRFFVAAGLGHSTSIGGWISFGFKIKDSTASSPAVYSYTTQETKALGQSMRTGMATVLFHKGPFALLGLMDGGMATTPTAFGSSFSGGGVLTIALDKLVKSPGIHLVLDARVSAGSTTPSTPIYMIGIAKSM